jgi:hypothetical protein
LTLRLTQVGLTLNRDNFLNNLAMNVRFETNERELIYGGEGGKLFFFFAPSAAICLKSCNKKDEKKCDVLFRSEQNP